MLKTHQNSELLAFKDKFYFFEKSVGKVQLVLYDKICTYRVGSLLFNSQFTQLIERSLWLQKVKKEDATENDISKKKTQTTKQLPSYWQGKGLLRYSDTKAVNNYNTVLPILSFENVLYTASNLLNSINIYFTLYYNRDTNLWLFACCGCNSCAHSYRRQFVSDRQSPFGTKSGIP